MPRLWSNRVYGQGGPAWNLVPAPWQVGDSADLLDPGVLHSGLKYDYSLSLVSILAHTQKCKRYLGHMSASYDTKNIHRPSRMCTLSEKENGEHGSNPDQGGGRMIDYSRHSIRLRVILPRNDRFFGLRLSLQPRPHAPRPEGPRKF